MKMHKIISTGFLVVSPFILVLCLPLTTFATSTVAISSSGGGAFQLNGIGVENASALDITITYDTTTLANPQIAEGPFITGAMTAINPNVPGVVRIVVVRIAPMSGNGAIATLTFEVTGPSPGTITSLSAKLANTKGAPLAVATQINNPSAAAVAANSPQNEGSPLTTSTPAQTAGSGSSGTAAILVPAVVATVPMSKTDESKGLPETSGTKDQGTLQPSAEPDPAAVKEATIAASETSAVPISKAANANAVKKTFAQESVLDRFKAYSGDRTAKACISLFEQENFIGFRQVPPVALSDGKSSVKVVFISPPGEKTAGDVTVSGGRLISLKKDPDNTNTWVAELAPEKGTYQASIAVLQGELKVVYPLTIAPKLSQRLDSSRTAVMTEADLAQMLKDRTSAAASHTGSETEGHRTYLDDYIVTANYLVISEKAAVVKNDYGTSLR